MESGSGLAITHLDRSGARGACLLEMLGCSVSVRSRFEDDVQPASTRADNSLERSEFVAVIVRILISADGRGSGAGALRDLRLRESSLSA